MQTISPGALDARGSVLTRGFALDFAVFATVVAAIMLAVILVAR